MQQSMLANKGCMLESRKLFFLQQLDFNNRIEHEQQLVTFKKTCLFCFNSLVAAFFPEFAGASVIC